MDSADLVLPVGVVVVPEVEHALLRADRVAPVARRGALAPAEGGGGGEGPAAEGVLLRHLHPPVHVPLRRVTSGVFFNFKF